MIWLWSNLWWLGPLLVLVAGLAHPVPRKLLEQVPTRWWIRLGVLALFGLTFQCGRWYERSVAQQRQEAAEKRADAKGERVAKRAQGEAGKAKDGFTKEQQTSERIREVVRYLECEPMPAGLRDDIQRKVEATRRSLPAD